MNKYRSTPAERRWCIDTIAQIQDFLPSQYSDLAQARLRQQGIEVSRYYIRQCKKLVRHDERVVKVLEQIARNSGKSIQLPTRDEIKQKYF